MIEKKEFLISKNVEEGVKLFGDITAKELIKTLSPSLLLSGGIFYIPFNPFVKIGVCAFLILIPGYLIMDRPIRKNIPVLYHLKTWMKYELRQKAFLYRKEKYDANVSEVENKRTKTKADSPKLHPVKKRIRFVITHDRQQINQTSENHLKKYGTNE